MACCAQLLLAVVAACSAYQTDDARWLLLKLTPDKVEVVHSQYRDVPTDFSALHGRKQHNGDHAYFYHMAGEMYHIRTGHDPTWTVYEGLDPNGEHAGIVAVGTGYTAVTVPSDATHIEVRRSNPHHQITTQHKTHIPAHHLFLSKFHNLAVTGGGGGGVGAAGAGYRVNSVEKQVGHPDKHKNLVFLAAGFTASEESKFKAIVTGAMKFLQYTAENFVTANQPLWVSSPWDRYMPLINVFAVFQPSVDSGATIPKRSDGSQHTDYPSVDKKTNLQCAYGVDQIRYLSCNDTLAFNLASLTPANPESSVVISLVNDVIYGGTGGSQKAFVYTGEWTKVSATGDALEICVDDVGFSSCPQDKKEYWQINDGNQFFQVLLHELGHADAKLADEYPYLTSTKDEQVLPNCYNQLTDPPWRHWQDTSLGVSEPTNLPDKSWCSYDGYYKPTPDLCVMKMQRNELCPVCAENVVLSLFHDIQEIASPRCPREDETLVVSLDDTNDETHYLSFDPSFIQGPPAMGREAEIFYARAHDLSTDPAPPYPDCTNPDVRKRKIRLKNDNLHEDPPLCLDTFKKIPLRKDEGDISVSWEWPSSTAAMDPIPASTPSETVNKFTAQPWAQVDGIWKMEGHLTTTNTDGSRTNNFRNNRAANILPILEFTSRQLGPGEHVFKLTVTDNTDFLQKDAWPTHTIDAEDGQAATEAISHMSHITEFKVRVVQPNDADWGHCNAALSDNAEFVSDPIARIEKSVNVCPSYVGLSVGGAYKYYCGDCAAGAVCNDTYPTQLFQVQADLAAALEGVEGLLTNWLGIVILVAFAAIIIVISIVGKCTAWYKDEMRVLPFFVKVGRYLMIATGVLTMGGAIALVVILALKYADLSVIGRSVAILAGVAAALLFLVGYCGFIASLLRSRVLLAVNGILLLLIVIFLLVVVVLSFKINKDIDTDQGAVHEFLIAEWERQIDVNPKFMCTFQSTFECSGLQISCHNKFHSQCPPDCEITNSRYPNPCLEMAKAKWRAYFNPIAFGSLFMLVAMFFGLLFNWALCCWIKTYKPSKNKINPQQKEQQRADQLRGGTKKKRRSNIQQVQPCTPT